MYAYQTKYGNQIHTIFNDKIRVIQLLNIHVLFHTFNAKNTT